ncbi:MAG: tetratricopeptide repeat protein [Pseudomonadota bacterium]
MRHARHLNLCLLLVATVGCATTTGTTRELRFPPMHVVAGPQLPDALDSYDDKTLFERGVEFLDASANEEALLYFGRLVVQFPESSFVKPSYYNLGVALSNLHRCEEALEKFDIYLGILDEGSEYQDSVDARFKKGVCLAELGRYQEVAEQYDLMLVEEQLRDADRVEALVDSGIGHFMLGDPVTAEYRMRDAIRLHRNAERLQRLESDYHIAQAHFYIGEIYRAEFSRLKLTLPPPGEDQKEQMASQLEDKCQRLLSAQYAYIRAIKIGNSGWATAAGYKIGTLYEELYDDMVNLPVPDDLDSEQAQLYLVELKKRVHVLVKKAILVWERSLDMANRTGSDNEWVRRTETSLERLRSLLQQDEELFQAADADSAPASGPATGSEGGA